MNKLLPILFLVSIIIVSGCVNLDVQPKPPAGEICDLGPCPTPFSQCNWKTKDTDIVACPDVFFS